MAEDAIVRLPAGQEPPEGLLDAFWRYERALMANDLNELDALFAPGPDTLRGDANGLLVGHDAIAAFRVGRGGAPRRTVSQVLVRPIGADDALVVAVVEPTNGGHGQQTQLWHRGPDGWVIVAAHVSGPTPAVDRTIWRTVGTPLVAPTAVGPLTAATVAVKDLFELEGFPVGAGNPAYLDESRPSVATAAAVESLLAAGAEVTGIARTDEFAYSIAGRNQHYGTPPNARVPGALPGGSSSGAASAVALGQATIGLATDTAGSIRVPASYQGLWGLRTTHGAVSREGLLPLAPSFDTVGWLTRDPDALATAARASLDSAEQVGLPAGIAAVDLSSSRLEPAVERAFTETIDQLRAAGLDGTGGDGVGVGGVAVDDTPVDVGDLGQLFEAFRIVQAFEAWATHGSWIRTHPGALGSDIAARFEIAAAITAAEAEDARTMVAEAAERIRDIVADRVLLLPSASSPAPGSRADAATIERTRASTLRLTCVAGIAGLPALSAPVMTVDAGPIGLSILGPRFTDLALIERGRMLADVLGRPRAQPEIRP